MAFSTLTLVLAVCMLTCSAQVSAGLVQHSDTPVTPRPVTTEYLDEYGTKTVGPIKGPDIPSSPIPRSTQYLDDLSANTVLEIINEPDRPATLTRTTKWLNAISTKGVPEIINEPDRPATLTRTTKWLNAISTKGVPEIIKEPDRPATLTRTTKWLNAISTKGVPEIMVTTGMATRVKEVVPRPAGPGQTKIPPKLSNGVSDRVMTLFLVAVGFFFVSLIWHLYIRVGWDRDGVKQLDKRAVGAMELGRLASTSQGDVESRGKGKARGAGLWLNEANKVS